MTKQHALELLNAAFPGVNFRVVNCSYARGTNDGKSRLEVSYNFIRHGELDVLAVLPMAYVWACGKKVAA